MLKNFFTNLHQAYQKELKKPFLIITAVFFGSLVLFTLLFYFQKNLTLNLMQLISKALSSKDLIDAQGNISALGLFKNNLQACTISILLGIIPFLFLNFFSLIINTVMVGIVAAANLMMGQGILFLLAALIPHGIFEIPAILLSVTLGFYLCKELVMKILGNRVHESFLTILKVIVSTYVAVIIPLLIVAALIEAYITPLVIQLV